MSIWNWLKDGDNQKTLAFIGAGIGGVVALLVQTGVIGKKEAPPAPAVAVTPAVAPPTAPQPTAPPAAGAPAPIVQVVTGSGATANAVQGNNIQINRYDGRH